MTTLNGRDITMFGEQGKTYFVITDDGDFGLSVIQTAAKTDVELAVELDEIARQAGAVRLYVVAEDAADVYIVKRVVSVARR